MNVGTLNLNPATFQERQERVVSKLGSLSIVMSGLVSGFLQNFFEITIIFVNGDNSAK